MGYLVFSLLFIASSAWSWSEVPLDKSAWQVLQYGKIRPNQVSFENKRMKIIVQGSAGPLIYPLPQKSEIKELMFDIKLDGMLKLQNAKQGEKGNDDFFFRIGLVYAGDKKLNFIQRLASPDWVKTLFELAEEETGISNITFYNVYSDTRLANQRRTHPYSDLLIENFSIEAIPHIVTSIPLNKKQKVLAFWISSDGDDTGSNFQVTVNKIRYR